MAPLAPRPAHGGDQPPVGAGMTFALCYLVGLVDGFDLLSNGLIAPRFAAEFAMGPGQVGTLFGLTSLGLLLGSAGGGWLADRVGPRRVLVGALLLFGTTSLLSTVMAGVTGFTATRALTGIGMGAALPNLLAIVNRVSPPELAVQRGTLIASSIPVGGALVGLMIFLFPADAPWRDVLYVGGVVPLVVAGALVARLPRELSAPPARQARARLEALFADRRLAVTTVMLWAACCTMLIISYMLINWLPSFFRAMGLGTRLSGLTMLLFSVTGSAAAITFGALPRREHLFAALLAGYGGTLVGIFLLPHAGHHVALVMLAVSVVSFFQTGAQYLLYGLTPAFYRQELRGTGAGAALASGRLGAIIGPSAAGYILAGGGSTTDVIHATLPLAAISMILALVLVRRLEPTGGEARAA